MKEYGEPLIDCTAARQQRPALPGCRARTQAAISSRRTPAFREPKINRTRAAKVERVL